MHNARKNYVLARDIINVWHPYYKNKPQPLDRASDLNVERLVEETMAYVGKYNFVDEDGRDFDDPLDSDSKTVSVRKSGNKVTISSVENKIGALRVVVFNHNTDGLDYFFIPLDDIKTLSKFASGKNSYKKIIESQYNLTKKTYARLEDYRASSFEELAINGTTTKLKQQTQPKLKEIKMTNTAIDLAENMLVSMGATHREVVRSLLEQLVITARVTPLPIPVTTASKKSAPATAKKPPSGVKEIRADEAPNKKVYDARHLGSYSHYVNLRTHRDNNESVVISVPDGQGGRNCSKVITPDLLHDTSILPANGIITIPCLEDGSLRFNKKISSKKRAIFEI